MPSSPSRTRIARALRLSLLLVVVLIGAGLYLSPDRAPAAVVWAVGDGGVPEPADDAVAAMIEREGLDRLLYLGDVYEHGTAEEYRTNYHPSFGRFRSVTSPTPGNHEWSNRAEGYDPYWGVRAPQASGGHYFSFELAGWHIISLNSEEDAGARSPQLDWLRRDLATYTGDCAIAFWHKPRFSAGPSPRSNTVFEPFWATLAGRAVAVLSGHDHNYQRLSPERGITQFVVGTGGRTHYATDESDPRLRAVDDVADGALRLELTPGRAEFAFVRADGRRLDSGALTCNPGTPTAGPPPAPPPPATPQPVAAVMPAVTIGAPRDGARHTRRLRVLRGTASVPEGGAVRLTVTRRRGTSCRAFDGRGFRASCRRPPLLGVRGGREWTRRLPPRPRPGAYRLVARVVRDGRVEARDAASFRIR